jgi:hypothetical protein
VARTVRHYLFDQDGSIKRIPRRLIDGLTFGKDAVPAYAGSRQRVLEVVIENEAGRPQAIDHANGYYFDFDSDGRIHRGLQRGLAEAMDLGFASNDQDNVVTLAGRRAKKQWRDVNRWTPTAEDLDRIVADLMRKPGVKAFESLVGVAAKRAALTYEAKSVIEELAGKVGSLGWRISYLSEKALPGFIHEARRRAAEEPEEEHFWEAIALTGERHREIKRLHRTGKGAWVAVFQAFYHDSPQSMTEAFVEHRCCEGELAAIEAMKAMLQKHSEIAGRSISVEARTMTELEWRLLNGRPH